MFQHSTKEGKRETPDQNLIEKFRRAPLSSKTPFHEMRAFSWKGEAKGAFSSKGGGTRLRRSFLPFPQRLRIRRYAAKMTIFPFAAQIYSAILHTKQRQRWCTDPASLIMNGRHPEWPPRRAALPISSLDSGQRSVAARRSGAAPGLSAAALLSLTQQFTVYIGRILDIPHQSTGGVFWRLHCASYA